MTRFHRRRAGRRGQALVEFSLVLIPFLVLLMGVLDLARGIYMLNGTAEAAREIARVTSVHPWSTGGGDLGSSDEAADVIAIQRKLIPGLRITPSSDIVCVDVTDTVIADSQCDDGDYVRVTVSAPFSPLTPVAKIFGDHTFSSISRIQIP